jgi:phage gp46-like protein
MAILDFQGAFDDASDGTEGALLRPYGKRGIFALDTPDDWDAFLVSPYDGVLLGDPDAEPDPPETGCPAGSFSWYMDDAGELFWKGAPPACTLVSPPEGMIGLTTDLVVDVTDPDDDFTGFLAYVYLASAGIYELAAHWDPITAWTFFPPYETSTVEDIPHGKRATFHRGGGWVDAEIQLQLANVDALGNSEGCQWTWTTPFVGAYSCGVGDEPGSPPVITLISPPEPELEPTEEIVIEVTDPDGDLALVLLHVNGALAFDGAAFFASFLLSSRVAISTGFRFTLRPPAGVWPPTVVVDGYAVDSEGHITQAQFVWQRVELEVEIQPAAPPAVAMGDIRLVWEDGTIDALIEDDDIAADLGLRTSVLLSLFTDRRAEDDDALPAEDGDRRGWWADELATAEGDRIGSRLWLLDRSKRQGDVVQRAEEMIREALAWMLADRVAERIDVEVETVTHELRFAITVHRPRAKPVRFRFAHVWEAP